MTLQDIEKALNPNMFLRVSRYDIVNLKKVQRFDFSVSGTLRIELEGGQEAWASRRFIPVVKERLKRRSFSERRSMHD
jgi:DNA-binding LytR/AlgR family response regulator